VMLARASSPLARAWRVTTNRPLPLSTSTPASFSPITLLAQPSTRVSTCPPVYAAQQHSALSSSSAPILSVTQADFWKKVSAGASGTRGISIAARRKKKAEAKALLDPSERYRAKHPRKPKEEPPVIPPCPEKVLCSVVLHRIPQIVPDIPQWWQDMLDLEDRKEAACGAEVPEEWWAQDEGMGGVEGSQEEEEITIYPRKTQADEEGNRRALERALDAHVYLVLKKTGKAPAATEGEWGLPTVERLPGESMRTAVLRSCETFIGTAPNIYPVGYMPMHFLDVGEGASAYRHFFYQVCLIHGPYKCNPELVQDFSWVTKEEMKEYLQGPMLDVIQDVTDD